MYKYKYTYVNFMHCYHTLQITTIYHLKTLCKLVFAKTWPKSILSQYSSCLMLTCQVPPRLSNRLSAQ